MKDSKKFLPTTKIGSNHLGDPFDGSFDWNFQHEIISDALSEDVKNYFLATCWVEKMGGKNLFLVGKKETSKIAVS